MLQKVSYCFSPLLTRKTLFTAEIRAFISHLISAIFYTELLRCRWTFKAFAFNYFPCWGICPIFGFRDRYCRNTDERLDKGSMKTLSWLIDGSFDNFWSLSWLKIWKIVENLIYETLQKRLENQIIESIESNQKKMKKLSYGKMRKKNRRRGKALKTV